MCRRWLSAPLVVALLLSGGSISAAQSALSGEPIRISRAAGPIVVDGDLGDEAWRVAERVETWYETNPGDNIDPKVRSVGHLAYDDRFFYAAFEFDDPDVSSLRAPYADHDNISGDYTDYGGVILDTRNDGHSAVLLLASPRGVQYDAVTDDASGEDSAPDFFWDAAARISERGWTLEIRVPFSSLRYRNVDPQTWGILLYRNRPRDFRYQMFSARLPRGGNCFICRANTLRGLQSLPAGGHVVVAPYVSASSDAHPTDGPGSPLDAAITRSRGGFDAKWTPSADNAIDVTLKPDFSQIESDTAQISTNERFALFFSEKRPFFLEGVELLSTPIRAVYTRTITAPRWGSRLTGKSRGFSYTALVADDAGGGSVVLPGSDSSTLVDQDFGSYVLVARVKRDLPHSFVGLLATSRETHGGNGHNLVGGPDLRWQPSDGDTVTAQWLFSDTTTPIRPDVASEWTGQTLSSHGAHVEWNHDSTHVNVTGRYIDFGDGFRADTGFVPQVGYREGYASAGWTSRPDGAIRRIQAFVDSTRQTDRAGALITRNVTPTIEMDVPWSGLLKFKLIDDRTRSLGTIIGRRQFGYEVRFSPSQAVAKVAIDGVAGEEIDFDNARPGHGATVNLSATLNPTNRLELALLQNQRWLDVDALAAGRRLFTARVSRVRGTYMFSSNSFARVVGQYVSTTREPGMYRFAIGPREGAFSGSALLAYKINWQSVLFFGYGDERELSEQHTLERSARQVFVKISYAFQR